MYYKDHNDWPHPILYKWYIPSTFDRVMFLWEEIKVPQNINLNLFAIKKEPVLAKFD